MDEKQASQHIAAVIFDMDGLMIDSETVYWAVGREMAQSFGKSVSEETLGRMMGRKPLESMVVYAQELGLTDDPQELLDRREAEVAARLRRGVPTMPGLMQTLQRLAELRLKLAIATSARRYLVDIVLEKLGVLRYFEVVQTSDDVVHGKPDPEIYSKAAARLGVSTAESVVLEDSSNGALSGKRAGAYTIAVPSIYTRAQDFSFVDYVARDLLDAVARIESLTKVSHGER